MAVKSSSQGICLFSLKFWVTGIILCFTFSCRNDCATAASGAIKISINEKTIRLRKYSPWFSPIEKQFMCDSLIDVACLDSTIRVKLVYASENNFTKVNLYGAFNKCYFPRPIAVKLAKAQHALKEKFPHYSLLVWDATRPHHIQQMMWDTLKIPFREKINYLAHPDSISLHNYGAAVDLTILDEKNNVELDMGTPFDFFGELAQPRLENKLLSKGKLTQEQIDNRNILRNAMRKGGFWPIPTEWWHFNAANKKWAGENMKLIQ